MRTLKFILLFLLIPTLCFGGVDFNGDADCINIGTMGNVGSTLDTTWFIFSGWIKTTTTSIMGLYGTFNDGSTTGIQVQLNMNSSSANATGRINVFMRDEGGVARADAVDTDTGFTDGSWHHLVIQNYNNDLEIYVDGSSQTIVNQFIGPADNNTANFGYGLVFGSRNNRGTYDIPVTGELSEVAFWQSSTQLSQAEVDLLYSRVKRIPLQIQPSNLQGYFPLDGYGDGTSLNTDVDGYKDLSGNGNHGQGVDADGDSDNVAETVLSYP